ncbi:MAG TPA: PotD/PotF family extracellular solute-binding protein [Anaerolineales bacterium]|nr:PotD/PotF family extracellular solute-binding protein [Anaerolineales bacterium]
MHTVHKTGWLILIIVLALVMSACGAVPATPSTGGEGGATKHVGILNKDMTDAEIKAEIEKEGSLIVGNWTYTANDELVKQFTQYVKDTYGADIEFTYEGSQAPSVYLTNLYAAQKAGNPAPYDVLAIEENYWAEAMANDAVDSFLPSDLVPNEKLVLDLFKHSPTTIAFQSTAFPAIVYNKKNAPFLASLKDLADPRLKGKVTLPLPGDITAGGFFLGLADELGKDYKDAAQMKEVVDWAVENIGPNVLKYTTDSSEMQQLLRSGAADAVGFWNSLARLEFFNGYTDTALLLPKSIYPANGYLWIPKGAPHPVLAQIFINWRLSPDVQFPNSWPIEHGPWSELSEGFLGPDYVTHVPDWFAKDYFTYFPTLDQIQTQFKTVDWNAYNASQKEWQDYYAQKIGQ